MKKNNNEIEESKSRSQIKREMQTLQIIGERLTTLSDDQLKKIDMPSELREAVDFAKTLKKHGARRRQMQRIGKFMRYVDPAPIQEALDAIDKGQQSEAFRFKQVETWRDNIATGNDQLIEEILSKFNNADRQKLRQLARNARKEVKTNKPPKASRALFRYLMELSKSD